MKALTKMVKGTLYIVLIIYRQWLYPVQSWEFSSIEVEEYYLSISPKLPSNPRFS